MNRRMLIQLTAPTVVIGAILFGACLASVWSINRLQRNLAQILSENVTSLEAAQELEIQLRQLRFHSFLLVIDPNEDRRKLVDKDHAGFEKAMETVRDSVRRSEERPEQAKPEQAKLVAEIQAGYRRY